MTMLKKLEDIIAQRHTQPSETSTLASFSPLAAAELRKKWAKKRWKWSSLPSVNHANSR